MEDSFSLFSLYTQTCVKIFSHSIMECDRYGHHKWGITIVNPRHFRLVMGNLVVATLESGTVWLAVDIPTPKEQEHLDVIKSWRWTHYQYKKPPSFSGYYWPMEWKYAKHEKVWPAIQSLHDRYLGKVAAVYKHLRLPSQKRHSDEALLTIEKYLSIRLPRPKYF